LKQQTESFTTQVTTRKLMRLIKEDSRDKSEKFSLLRYTGRAIDRAIKLEAKKRNLI